MMECLHVVLATICVVTECVFVVLTIVLALFGDFTFGFCVIAIKDFLPLNASDATHVVLYSLPMDLLLV